MKSIEYRARLWSGLVLSVFVTLHLGNHMLGIVSLEVAESFRRIVRLPWSNPLGGFVLYGALLLHFALALVSLYRRRSLRMPGWEACQLALGIAFVPLVATHAVATRGAQEMLELTHEYARTVIFIWSSPTETAKQTLLILTAWGHAAVGVHFWLRLKAGYRRIHAAAIAAMTVVPLLALVGFYRSGRESELLPREMVQASIDRLGVSLPDYQAFVSTGSTWVLGLAGSLLLLTVLARMTRASLNRRQGRFIIEHANGSEVQGVVGQTLLEALRAAGIPHASVCGGRARCTTCRVRVGPGSDALEAPSALESAALERIGAEPTIRLACQTRPAQRLAITPLLPPNAAAQDAGVRGGVAGTESVVTVLFVDLRGSTRLGQKRLPYDVLFILNQFFAEMAQSLRDTDGHYAQFNGDGLMAIYGHETPVQAGARAALRGAVEMLRRLDRLNARLGGELEEPLRIGIGVHTGEAIVGTMGPPASPIFSAIGDNINVAARLEALTKDLACPLVVSAQTAKWSGLDFTGFRSRAVEIRGRTGHFDVLAIDAPDPLSQRLEDAAAGGTT